MRRFRLRIPVAGEHAARTVEFTDDAYSDRLRCDHPPKVPPRKLGTRLKTLARRHGRGRVMVLAPDRMERGFIEAGFRTEAIIPGFYEGKRSCAIMSGFVDHRRARLANPVEVAKVDKIVRARRAGKDHPHIESERASESDAAELAELLGTTFPDYPTPSANAHYLEKQLREGTPFRVIRHEGRIAACASADLVESAKTAELTDCATRPEFRGRGYMRFILTALMDDLRALGYPTAFTLSRARIPGMNLVFARLGFELQGRMTSSCRIGEGVEDINVWSRYL